MNRFLTVSGVWIFRICCTHCDLAGQGLDNIWLLGYNAAAGSPWGSLTIDFQSGAADIYPLFRAMDQTTTSANISDSAGTLLFYTNGYYIADANGDTMANGAGLNPSSYTSDIGNGLWIPQADLILPKPGDPSIYYLFHSTVDDMVNITSQYLYLTTIDMSLNGGLGAVVSKNQILIDDTLNIGKITAVKHANGRDWWVFCHKVDSDTFFRLLVTPTGISAPVLVGGGTIRPADGGQVAFSPDGSRFASYSMVDDLDLLDFDRCDGTFSNPRHVVLPGSDFAGGGRLLAQFATCISGVSLEALSV